MARSSFLLLPLGALAAAPAFAQSLTYTTDTSGSSVQLDASLGLDLTGDFRGVFDAATNPGGTRTQLGLFGDDGTNQRADLSLLLALGLDLDGALDGGFTLDLSPATGAALVEDLAFDVVGSPSSAGIDLTFEFGTFRTFSPTSLYIGGIPLTLPIGSADIDNVRLEQLAPGAGTFQAGGAPGLLDVTVVVPVGLSLEISSELLGGTTPIGPIPLALPLGFTVDRADCGSALSGAAGDSFMQSVPSPFPFDFDDVPVDLPTILPPGQTANLLLSASLDGLSFDGSFSVLLEADSSDGRVEDVCPGQANSTGVGAAMSITGSASVSEETLGLLVTGLPVDTFGMLIMSRSQDFVPGFGGSQGDLCLGEPCFRFVDNVANSGMAGEILIEPDFGALPQGQSFVEAETWNFQLWYRDANPGATSNTSGAVAVTFCR